MSDDRHEGDRWRTLPPRTPLDELVAGQEVPPKPQVIADPSSTEVDEALRYPV
ncbi:hypothetical protein ACFOY4_24550 [Actinomadura syzygii]|uniref:hypothetical protein n=1 Tax=Actinomadura syzygii TaxID=1427538 RepID=UPI00165288C3|nr:hypothetical protein [Actinomadura syzygii]